MSDRFDLEQGIIQSWGVVDDLKAAKDMAEVSAICKYYEIKFERLWDTFEEFLANNKITKIEHESNDAY